MKVICKSSIVCALLLICAGNISANPFVSIDKIDSKSAYPEIKVLVKISGGSKFKVNSLTEENISIFEDGQKVKHSIQESGSEDIYRLVVFSFNPDKNKKFARYIKESAAEFVKASGERSKLAVYQYTGEGKLHSPFDSPKSSVFNAVDDYMASDEKTSLYNTLYDAIDLLSRIKSSDKRIIAFSDGREEGSSFDLDDVVRYARDSNVSISFIYPSEAKTVKNISRIARMTSGSIAVINLKKGSSPDYSPIFSSNSGRYLIRYQTNKKPDGSKQQVEVRFAKGDLRDRDSSEFSLEKIETVSDFFDQGGMLLLVLVLLLIVLLISLVLYFIRRENQNLARVYEAEYKKSALDSYYDKYEKLVELEEAQRFQEAEILMAEDPAYSYASAWLVEKDGPEPGKKFPLYWDEITIGRSKENGVVLEDESVSLNHSKIKKVKNSYYILDLASDNGTYVNGKKLLRPRALYDWDELKLGRVLFIFRGSNISS